MIGYRVDSHNTIVVFEEGEVDCDVDPYAETVDVRFDIRFSKQAIELLARNPVAQQAIGAALIVEAERALREGGCWPSLGDILEDLLEQVET